MVLGTKGKNFPRGGQKAAISVPKKGNFNLFGKKSSKFNQQKNSRKTAGIKMVSSTNLKLSHVQFLSRKTLTEGTLVLGCVRSIKEFALTVSLPGRIIGDVSITNVSAQYTKYLQSLIKGSASEKTVLRLDEMFHVGQIVVTRVISMGDKISLSLSPEAIQSDWSSRSLNVGTVLVAAVSCIEENGYIMDTGINNVKAFLETTAAREYEKKWNEGRPLCIGQVVKCVVTKSSIASFVTTINLSADPRKVYKAVSEDAELSVDMLLPGTLFNISVSKVMKNGLEVKLGNNFTGYVFEDHLADPWDTLEDHSSGDNHKAILLYVRPIVKFMYFSLKKDLCNPEASGLSFSEIKIGDVVPHAMITHVDTNGVTLKLLNKFKGIVSLHHCSKEGSGLEVHHKFKIGTKHNCRVLAYDYMAQLVICSLDKNIVNAEYFQASDLLLGMKVKCEIKEHIKTGTKADIDFHGRKIPAFVCPEHLGNFKLSNPEKKFPVGSQHVAKVLCVDGRKVQLTLKPQLVNSDIEAIYRLEDVKIGMSYEGVVAMIKNNGFLVTFYGGIKGWLNCPRSQFKAHSGQVVKCYVHHVNIEDKKLYLSLKNEKAPMGDACKATITKCTALGLEVDSTLGSGLIPAQHLTDIPTLAESLINTYSPGQVVDAYCFGSEDCIIFTLRPSLIKYFQEEEMHTLSDVKVGQLLPCALIEINKGLLLQLPLTGNTMTRMPVTRLVSRMDDSTQISLVKHQGLIVKKIKSGFTARLDFTPEATVSILLSFWRDYDRIAEHEKRKGNPLKKLKPGNRVRGKVIGFEEAGYVLSLDCGAQGIVTPKLSAKNVGCGDTLEGIVIYVDYQKNCVELVTSPCIMESINTNKVGGLPTGAQVCGKVLTVHPEFVVVVLEHGGMLAYVSTRSHINDVVPDLSKFVVGEKTGKLIVQTIERGRIICTQQRFELKCKANAKVCMNQKANFEISIRKLRKIQKSKRKHEESSAELESEGVLIKKHKSSVHDEYDISGSSQLTGLQQSEENMSKTSKKNKKNEKHLHEQDGEAFGCESGVNSEDNSSLQLENNISGSSQLTSDGFVCDSNPSLLERENEATDSSSDEDDKEASFGASCGTKVTTS